MFGSFLRSPFRATVHYPLSTVHCPLSTIHCPLSTVHCHLCWIEGGGEIREILSTATSTPIPNHKTNNNKKKRRKETSQ